jgi:hypothetical protein
MLGNKKHLCELLQDLLRLHAEVNLLVVEPVEGEGVVDAARLPGAVHGGHQGDVRRRVYSGRQVEVHPRRYGRSLSDTMNRLTRQQTILII